MSRFNPFEDAVDFSFWKKICEQQGTLQYFKRGEYFVHSDEVLKQVGWIATGSFKHSLIDNSGNHKAVGFVFEGTVLANYISAILEEKMPTDIIALEDSKVFVVPVEIMRNHLAYDPTLNIHFVQALFNQAYTHILNDYRYTPEERYNQLIKRYPRILELVSVGEIASNLNISRRQLHRIRRCTYNKL